MKKIECIIRPGKLDDVNIALNKYGIRGMTVSQVMGCGLSKGRKEFFRGTSFDIKLLPKIKLEIVVTDKDVDNIVEIVKETAYTGEIGDGKIFISTIDNAIRIRTGEDKDDAI
jgi:nitrogen regulatory protein P-II 1